MESLEGPHSSEEASLPVFYYRLPLLPESLGRGPVTLVMLLYFFIPSSPSDVIRRDVCAPASS